MLQRDAKEKRRKGEERQQEAERHTQGTEPTSQPRPTPLVLLSKDTSTQHILCADCNMESVSLIREKPR
jgi:hypothetical protein